MALQEVCGYRPGKQSFGSNLEQDNDEYCGNFSANSSTSCSISSLIWRMLFQHPVSVHYLAILDTLYLADVVMHGVDHEAAH